MLRATQLGRRVLVILLGFSILSACARRAAPPAASPAGKDSAIALASVAKGLKRPSGLYHAGDGSGRLYILEQDGRIRLLEDGKLSPTPFLDISDRVLSEGNEQGLLGLAFHPDYRENGMFFVHYTGLRGETVLARHRRDGSAEVLLTIEQPFANHNGGTILFGPDGYLYMALGDGGSAGDPGNRAQDLESLLGKILRLDVWEPGPYAIPPDNPFVGKPGRDEIWAYGLRNPWRISFDRATGDLYIADVGQQEREEVNVQPGESEGGQNYGWRIFEGTHRYAEGEAPGAVAPVAEYTHADGCSITGGYVYRGEAVPDLWGTYLYADYCKGTIWGLRLAGEEWKTSLLLQTDLRITAFGDDEESELYAVDRRNGEIFQMRSSR